MDLYDLEEHDPTMVDVLGLEQPKQPPSPQRVQIPVIINIPFVPVHNTIAPAPTNQLNRIYYQAWSYKSNNGGNNNSPSEDKLVEKTKIISVAIGFFLTCLIIYIMTKMSREEDE